MPTAMSFGATPRPSRFRSSGRAPRPESPRASSEAVAMPVSRLPSVPAPSPKRFAPIGTRRRGIFTGSFPGAGDEAPPGPPGGRLAGRRPGRLGDRKRRLAALVSSDTAAVAAAVVARQQATPLRRREGHASALGTALSSLRRPPRCRARCADERRERGSDHRARRWPDLRSAISPSGCLLPRAGRAAALLGVRADARPAPPSLPAADLSAAGRRAGAKLRHVGAQLAVAVVSFLLVLLVWTLTHSNGGVAAALGRGQTPVAPSFVLKSLSRSGSINLETYGGRGVVVNFLDSWCGACSAEAAGVNPDLRERQVAPGDVRDLAAGTRRRSHPRSGFRREAQCCDCAHAPPCRGGVKPRRTSASGVL